MSVPDTRTESAAALHQQIRVDRRADRRCRPGRVRAPQSGTGLAGHAPRISSAGSGRARLRRTWCRISFRSITRPDGAAREPSRGLRLPPGGPSSPASIRLDTVRRESREELGIEARSSPLTGCRPLFVTVTETVPSAAAHVDVSLWYVLSCAVGEPLTPDEREFSGIRWWTRTAIAKAAPAQFDPHLGRMLAKLDQAARPGGRRDRYREEKR